MAWVLWDIIVPLLLAFALGLTMGWLLWRWRRAQVAEGVTAAVAKGSEAEESASAADSDAESSAEKIESINSVLIAERDEAVERANAAENSLSEAQVEILKLKTELPADDPDASKADSVTEEAIDSSEKFQNLVTMLAREQEQRAEVDLELTEANDRYEILERELAKVKEAAAEFDETRLATLQEDLDLSQKVIEEKDQQYLDSVLEMEKLIEDRDERIATLEASIADAVGVSVDSVERVDDRAAGAERDEVENTELNTGSLNTGEQEIAESADDVTADEPALDDKDRSVDPDTGNSDGAADTVEKSSATARMSEGQQQTGSGRQSEALISQATAAEIAVALAEEFDIDTSEDPQSETVAEQGSSGQVSNEAMSPISVEGDAANEDPVVQFEKMAADGPKDSDSADAVGIGDVAEADATELNEADDEQAEVVQTQLVGEGTKDTTQSDTGVQDFGTDDVKADDKTDVRAGIENDDGAEADDSDSQLTAELDEPQVVPPVSADSDESTAVESSDNASLGDSISAVDSAVDSAGSNGESDSELLGGAEELLIEEESDAPVDEDSVEKTTPAVIAVDDEVVDDSVVNESVADEKARDELEELPTDKEDEQQQSRSVVFVHQPIEEKSTTDKAGSSAVTEKKSALADKKSTASSAKSAKKTTSKKKVSRKKKKKSNANGYSPTAWDVPARAPTEKNRDQLTDIKGIGPVLEGLLHNSGIYYFKQVALLDKDGVSELQEQIPQFPGRIKRDKWVSQAKSLHRRKYGVAAKNS